jgi:hypothetical protein
VERLQKFRVARDQVSAQSGLLIDHRLREAVEGRDDLIRVLRQMIDALDRRKMSVSDDADPDRDRRQGAESGSQFRYDPDVIDRAHSQSSGSHSGIRFSFPAVSNNLYDVNFVLLWALTP